MKRSVTTAAADRARRPPTPDGGDGGSRTGPIRRVVLASMLGGSAGAAVLTLVVVAGASEHVITGSALLGFATGWALLAVLSSWLTRQPQRWALVPAAGMAVTGLGLLVLAPGDRGLTAAGWCWPPLLLALAVWAGRRVRRSLAAGSGRWLLYPVVVAMVLAAAGGMTETVARVSDQRDDAVPGQSYDVGGRRLHLDCSGSGSPTVVLQSGLGEMSPHWARIAPAVGRTTRVCAYDRAGQGWSDDAPAPQDGRQAAADLHTLLDRAGEAGPHVLVGHSTGGSYAMVYAAQYPDQVTGVVLLDPSDPYRSSAGHGSVEAGAPAEIALLPSLARLGLGRLLPTSAWSRLPEPAAGQVQAFAAGPRGWRNQRDEYAAMPALFAQARSLSHLGSTPLVVLTTTGSPHAPGFTAAHDRMAALSRSSSHRFVDATHVGLLDEAEGARISVGAIEDVVRAVRTGSPLTSGPTAP
ncbi:alpha/beta fold hydrolase [Geodermatophilus sp. SYSU D00697]